MEASERTTSHGGGVGRRHVAEWVMVLILIIMELVAYIIPPFRRYVGEEMMKDLKFPLKSVSIRFWTVPLYAVVLPVAIFVAVYVRRKDIHDLHHAVLGILLSVLITGVLTESTKVAVGSPRPDFFWRCFPDGIEVYDRLGNVVCHGKKSLLIDGYKSFPSGHAAWSFAGLGFLSLYLYGKLKAFEERGKVAKRLVVLFPLLLAYVVGIFMVNDYMHRWQDVFVGALLGLVVAAFCYLQFFPNPCHLEGWQPHAFSGASEVSMVANTRTTNPTRNVGGGLDIEGHALHESGGGDRSNTGVQFS